MRVLILTDFFPNRTVPYEAHFIAEMVKRTAAQHPVVLFVPRVIYPPFPRYRPLRRHIDADFIRRRYGINAFVFRYPHLPVVGEWFMPYKTLLQMALIIRRRVSKLDLIHAHWAYRSGFWGAWLARWLKVPLVITVHGSDVNLWLQDRKKSRKIRFALREAKGIITASQHLYRKILPLAPQARLAHICGGFDPERFRFDPAQAGAEHRSSPARLLCIANFYPVKGIDRLIGAADILRKENHDFTLTIVGDGPERPKYERLVQKLGLEKTVQFVGGIMPEQIPAYLQNAHYLVIPSLDEGIPIVMLEALAMGVPVVGTPVGKMPELLASGELGVLAQSSQPEDLARAISTALQKDFDRQNLAEFARQFSWDHVTEQTEAFYREILETAHVAGKK